MTISVIFLLLIILMILIKSSFSLIENFLLCKLLPSLDYPYTLGYKKVLLKTLSTSYEDYQRFLLYKILPILGFCSQH